MPCSSFPSSHLHTTPQELDIQIDDATHNAWKNDALEDAEALLTTAIHQHQHPGYHFLAARALVRARLQYWDEALVDAQMVLLALLSHSLALTPSRTKAIDTQPSIIAYIAKSLAHVGKGEKDEAYLACDIAFEHSHSSHISLPLSIKVGIPALGFRSTANPFQTIVMFVAGEHYNALSYMDSLTAAVRYDSTCHMIQARARCAPARRISQLTSQKGLHVSSPWEITLGAQGIRGCHTVIRACTCASAAWSESTAFGGHVGNWSSATCRNRSLSLLTDVRMEIG